MGLFSRQAEPKVDPLDGFRRRLDDSLSEEERKLAAHQEQLRDVGIPIEDAKAVIMGAEARRFIQGLATANENLRIGRYLVEEMTSYIQMTMPQLIVTKGVEHQDTKRAIEIATGLAQCLGWLNEVILRADQIEQTHQQEETDDEFTEQ